MSSLPAHAVVLSLDEKSQMQGLDRTQPGLPLKKGRGATMTHDYKRQGTTTLSAALDVLDGIVFGRNMARHRHQEFLRFLNALEREIPAGKTVHAISTTRPRTRRRRSGAGWPGIRAGPSTSRRPRAHG